LLSKYHPAAVQIEDEEERSAVYNGEAWDYQSQLITACDTAHKLGVVCIGGGLSPTSALLLTRDYFLSHGNTDAAQDYVNRVLIFPDVRRLVDLPNAQNLLVRAGDYIVVADTHADIVMYHWVYMDTLSLRETESIMSTKVSSPLGISIDLSSFPDKITDALEILRDHKRPLIIWDTSDNIGPDGAIAQDGTLLEGGKAFRDFVNKK